jgi:plasmid stabilization system protein ParE
VDYRLLYTQRALNDLAEIVGYIAEDDPDAASRFGTSLLDYLELLRTYPRIGPPIRDRLHVRRLVHSPILIYYTVRQEDHTVEVLHLRHAARREPKF